MTEEDKTEEDKARENEIASCVSQWNKFVLSLIQAKTAWQKYVKTRQEGNIGLEAFALKYQQILYLANPTGEFDFLVEDIITHRDLDNYLKSLILR